MKKFTIEYHENCKTELPHEPEIKYSFEKLKTCQRWCKENYIKIAYVNWNKYPRYIIENSGNEIQRYNK